MARTSLYLPDAVYRLWREELPWVNLSKLATAALLAEAEGHGIEVVHMCDVCRQRVGLPPCECQRPKSTRP